MMDDGMMNDAAETAFQKALSFEQSGELAAACAEFARATELNGADPRYWIGRGVALSQLRHFAEAARCLRKRGTARSSHHQVCPVPQAM